MALKGSEHGGNGLPAVATLETHYQPCAGRTTHQQFIDGRLRHGSYFAGLLAHFDHLGMRGPGVNGDSVFNGADDDASGVTAVLEIARQIHAGATPKRTIVFAATMGFLLMPKLFGWLAICFNRRLAERFGGVRNALGSVLCETLISALLAPLHMLFQSGSNVFKLFLNGNIRDQCRVKAAQLPDDRPIARRRLSAPTHCTRRVPQRRAHCPEWQCGCNRDKRFAKSANSQRV